MQFESEKIFSNSKLSEESKELFFTIEKLLLSCVAIALSESMWSGHFMYSNGDRAVLLAPFNGHVTIISNPVRNRKMTTYPNAIIKNYEELSHYYQLTPKGMLKIFCGQTIQEELLKKVFIESLM